MDMYVHDFTNSIINIRDSSTKDFMRLEKVMFENLEKAREFVLHLNKFKGDYSSEFESKIYRIFNFIKINGDKSNFKIQVEDDIEEIIKNNFNDAYSIFILEKEKTRFLPQVRKNLYLNIYNSPDFASISLKYKEFAEYLTKLTDSWKIQSMFSIFEVGIFVFMFYVSQFILKPYFDPSLNIKIDPITVAGTLIGLFVLIFIKKKYKI